MRVAIVGAGAIGGVVATLLERAGHPVAIVARPATAALIAAEGLEVRVGAETLAARPRVVADARELGPQDVVLVGFKAQDWEAGLPQVLPLVGPGTAVVPMLNGIPWWYFEGHPAGPRVVRAVDPAGALLAAIPGRDVVGCVVYMAAERLAPHRVSWNGRKRFLLGSPLPGGHGKRDAVAALLAAGGIETPDVPDIRYEVWYKLLGNATYNPLSVVAGAVMGRIGEAPPLRRIMRLIMEECVAVAATVGVSGGFDIEDRMKLSPAMRDIKTSMLQDYLAGRPLELSGIVDAIVELGRDAGVPTPTLETIGALAAERFHATYGA